MKKFYNYLTKIERAIFWICLFFFTVCFCILTYGFIFYPCTFYQYSMTVLLELVTWTVIFFGYFLLEKFRKLIFSKDYNEDRQKFYNNIFKKL